MRFDETIDNLFNIMSDQEASEFELPTGESEECINDDGEQIDRKTAILDKLVSIKTMPMVTIPTKNKVG